MNTDQKKNLLRDVKVAFHALGQILDDGPHDMSQLRGFDVARLHDQGLDVLAGLSLLKAKLESEIGTDNL